MAGPYRIRIVQADGVARYLTAYPSGDRTIFASDKSASTYKTIGSARRSARKYLGDRKHLGTHFADIVDDNNEERSIEI